MKPDALSFEARQMLRSQQKIIQRLVNRDKTPLSVLLLAALAGLLTGLAGVAFEKATGWVQHQRLATLHSVADHGWLFWSLAFIFSALLAVIGYWLMRRYAPEAGGSGIPEIEGAMNELRPVRWWRVIPVKFIGGMGTLGAGMVLGREGPTVQLGGNIGCMVLDLLNIRSAQARYTLLATSAAAGLAVAFNAPLAGILFIFEEMRVQLRYKQISIQAVFIGAIISTVVFRMVNGGHPLVAVGRLLNAPAYTLWLYFMLGAILGVAGLQFNQLIFRMQDLFWRLHGGEIKKWLLLGALIGGCCGILELIMPATVGGGFELIPMAVQGNYSLSILLFIFIARIITTLLCFSSGAPGGLFAPTLALGTLLGAAYGLVCAAWLPSYHLQAGTFAIAGMGALFAASVRTPLTGIVLVLEMTNNYQLILPMIITCLSATLVAQMLGGKPLYPAILARILEQQARQSAKDASGKDASKAGSAKTTTAP